MKKPSLGTRFPNKEYGTRVKYLGLAASVGGSSAELQNSYFVPMKPRMCHFGWVESVGRTWIGEGILAVILLKCTGDPPSGLAEAS